jgi:hypothetical protein
MCNKRNNNKILSLKNEVYFSNVSKIYIVYFITKSDGEIFYDGICKMIQIMFLKRAHSTLIGN